MKASEIAKQFSYTADYVGQLCRAKKVDARLVGRTWYVNPTSVQEHKAAKYNDTTSEDTSDHSTPVAITRSTKAVPPVVKNKTVKSLAKDAAKVSFLDRLAAQEVQGGVSYQADSEALYPSIQSQPRESLTEGPELSPVDAATAHKVSISGADKPTKFTPDELPEVSLSGKVAVVAYEDAPDTEPETDQHSHKNKAISDKRDAPSTTKKPVHTTVRTRKMTANQRRIIADGEQAKMLRSNATAKDNGSQHTLRVTEAQPAVALTPMTLLVRVSPLIATILAILCSAVVFSAGTTIFVSSDIPYQSEVVLQVANLLELLRP